MKSDSYNRLTVCNFSVAGWPIMMATGMTLYTGQEKGSFLNQDQVRVTQLPGFV